MSFPPPVSLTGTSSASLGRLVKTLGVFAAVALLIFIALVSYESVEGLEQRAARVAYTHEVKEHIAALEAEYARTRFLWRSYLLTGNAPLLAEFRSGVDGIPQRVASLRTLTIDNPRQTARITEIRSLLESDWLHSIS